MVCVDVVVDGVVVGGGVGCVDVTPIVVDVWCCLKWSLVWLLVLFVVALMLCLLLCRLS